MNIAYVNGRYIAKKLAKVSIDDRGYQFSDAIYEVITVFNNILLDADLHLERLKYSLNELQIAYPFADTKILQTIIQILLQKNKIQSGLVYIQISRGVAPRSHPFPPKDTKPSIVITTKSIDLISEIQKKSQGIKIITVPDLRWKRCDIKTVSLLPNILAQQQAKEAGCYEAWQIDENGFITEGTMSNAWILTKDNILKTRPASHDILNGITRRTILKIAQEQNINVQEEAFTIDEAYNAKEAYISSATSFVTPIIQMNDTKINNAIVGDFHKILLKAYFKNFELEV
jgi:D-alanine transaminase